MLEYKFHYCIINFITAFILALKILFFNYIFKKNSINRKKYLRNFIYIFFIDLPAVAHQLKSSSHIDKKYYRFHYGNFIIIFNHRIFTATCGVYYIDWNTFANIFFTLHFSFKIFTYFPPS